MTPELILVFDTETTGLTLHPDAPLAQQPKIIELGLALMDAATGEVVDSYNQLIHPGEEITAEITKITGITNEQLEGQPRFREVVPVLSGYFARATHVVAHNLPFDKAMIMNDLARVDDEAAAKFPWPAGEHCTVGLHKAMWGRNPRLIELYEFAMGKSLEQTHRALDDVMALVEVIVALEIHRAIATQEPRPPAGYTAEELDRDNPHNQWMKGV